jgi:hypothetical protein
MKKQFAAAIFVSSFCSAGLSAQTKDTGTVPVKTGNEWRMPDDAVKRSQDFADRLKKDLGLDEETTKKIFQACLANTKPLDEIKVLPLSDKEKADRLKANQAAFKQTLKGILSVDEYVRYVKMGAGKS